MVILAGKTTQKSIVLFIASFLEEMGRLNGCEGRTLFIFKDLALRDLDGMSITQPCLHFFNIVIYEHGIGIAIYA